MSRSIPAIVLGGTGYVAGELLRLIAGHPDFELAAVLSESQPGERIATAFPHLRCAYSERQFQALPEIESMVAALPRSALFCAAPHGAAASLIDRLLQVAENAGTQPRVVDVSADYRYPTAAAYEAVYKHAHAAPARLTEFSCALPEHQKALRTRHVAHPGCFATATLLASVPLLASGWAEPVLFVNGVTGSTGSGRAPTAATHHPLRHGDLYAYNALSHRHAPEIASCARQATGVEAEFSFVPHSGPFARGIHVTVQARLNQAVHAEQLLAAYRHFYAGAPFVQIVDSPPRLKEVVGSNYAQVSVASNGRTAAIMCAIDNLDKGAAGGAMQWMNRLFGLDETAGLTAPAAGWT